MSLPLPENSNIQITRLPEIGIDVLFDRTPVTAGQIIEMDSLNLLTIVNNTGFKGVLGSFGYKVMVDEKKSEERFVYLNFEAETGVPDLIDEIVESNDGESISFADIVNYDFNYDQISITGITGNFDNWLIGGDTVVLNTPYEVKYLFENLAFKPVSFENNEEYSVLIFSFLRDGEVVLNGNKIQVETIWSEL